MKKLIVIMLLAVMLLVMLVSLTMSGLMKNAIDDFNEKSGIINIKNISN